VSGERFSQMSWVTARPGMSADAITSQAMQRARSARCRRKPHGPASSQQVIGPSDVRHQGRLMLFPTDAEIA